MLEYVRETQSRASETESGENKGLCKTPAFPASLACLHWTQRNPVEILGNLRLFTVFEIFFCKVQALISDNESAVRLVKIYDQFPQEHFQWTDI